MNVARKLLSLLLVSAMLLAALPALAVEADEPSLLQTTASTKLYEGPGSGTGTVQTLAKYTAVLAYGREGGYTYVRVGKASGYISTDRLSSIKSSARVQGIAIAGANAALYTTPEKGAQKVGSIAKGSAAAVLLEVDGYTAVRAGSAIGFAKSTDLKLYGASSKAIGSVLFSKSASLRAGSSSSDAKLESIAKGELAELLYTDGKTAVLRKGSSVGACALDGAVVYDAKTPATGKVTAKSSLTLYAGPGSKYAKLGSMQKGEAAEQLGEYSSYTVVRANGVIGLAATKSIAMEESDSSPAGSSPTGSAPGKGAFPTGYACAADDANVYASASTSARRTSQLRAGTAVQVLEESTGWAKITVFQLTGYVETKHLQALTTVPKLELGGYGSADYSANGLALIAIMNTYRADAGYSALKTDATLMKAAEVRAKELERSFGHMRPNGLGVNTIDFSIASENIARGNGPTALDSAEKAASAFMGSSAHKANAMNGAFTKTGAASYFIGTTRYWVQLFG